LPGQNNPQKLLAWWNKGEFQATFGDPMILMLKFVLLSVWAIQNHPQKNRLINASPKSALLQVPKIGVFSTLPGSKVSLQNLGILYLYFDHIVFFGSRLLSVAIPGAVPDLQIQEAHPLPILMFHVLHP
jgi:hypothetical protein